MSTYDNYFVTYNANEIEVANVYATMIFPDIRSSLSAN